jgi:hypothetical protein
MEHPDFDSNSGEELTPALHLQDYRWFNNNDANEGRHLSQQSSNENKTLKTLKPMTGWPPIRFQMIEV